MKEKRVLSVFTVCVLICSILLPGLTSVARMGEQDSEKSGQTDFISSAVDIDELLRREYVDNVPLGYSEDIFSLYQPGWGFDRTDVYRTGISGGFGMPVTITSNGVPLLVDEAEFMPSYVTSSFTPQDSEEPEIIKTNIALNAESIFNGSYAEGYPRVDASFSQEKWGRSLVQAYQGVTGGDASNWNTYREADDTIAFPIPEGGDWTSIQFEKTEEINEIRIHTFTDGNLAHPDKITIYCKQQDEWQEIAAYTENPQQGWSSILLDEAVAGMEFKLAFEVAQGKALGVDSIEYLQYTYDHSGLERVEINHARGASRTSYPLASASFSQEKWGASLEYAFDGNTQLSGNASWNTYRETGDELNYPKPDEGDWIALDFNESQKADSLALYVYADGGGTYPPADVKVMYKNNSSWIEVEYLSKPDAYTIGKNILSFNNVEAAEYKIIFEAQDGKCVSLNEIELIQTAYVEPPKISVTGYKYISPDNMLTAVIQAKNEGSNPAAVEVAGSIPTGFAIDENAAVGNLAGFAARLQGDSGFLVQGMTLKKQVVLEAGESTEYKITLSLSEEDNENKTKIEHFLKDNMPLTTQKEMFNSWFRENIPYIDVPDEALQQIYYFRWYTYRNHIRMTTDDYYIISEFLPNVPWAGKHNSINCPAGLQVAEGRWLKNSQYLDDYLAHWLDYGGSSRSYSFWIADAYYNRYLANGDDMVLNYVDKLKENYEAWSDRYNPSLGLYWQHNDRDGMENSISSTFGYRPTINSYMYGDAVALSNLCMLIQDQEGAELYASKASNIKENFDQKTWDSEDKFYKVIASDGSGNLTNGEELQSVKEAIGYVPWMFNMPDDNPEYSSAWGYLTDEEYFLAPYGILTAEKSRARITPEYEYGTGICRWDGPVWPFATSQTLTGMANLLNNYSQEYITAEDYYSLLINYAKAQYKDGSPWIAENLDGYTGRWIADEGRSPNYNHSSFNDLVISGLFGIRPREDETLQISPLIPEGKWDSFCLENVPYHGKNITLLYDQSGETYGQGSGFKVYIDGILVHTSAEYEEVYVSLDKEIEETEETEETKETKETEETEETKETEETEETEETKETEETEETEETKETEETEETKETKETGETGETKDSGNPDDSHKETNNRKDINKQKGKNVKTGDTFLIENYLLVLVVASIIAILSVYKIKKKNL